MTSVTPPLLVHSIVGNSDKHTQQEFHRYDNVQLHKYIWLFLRILRLLWMHQNLALV